MRLTQDNTWVTDQELKFLDASLPAAFRDSVQAEFLPSYSTHRLQLSGERDHRDNPLLTTRGGLQVASAEVAGGPFKGSTSFTKFQASASWFTPLHRQGWVLATRVRGGVVKPFGERQDFVPSASVDREVARVPTEDVFRLGGVNSVRGYAENEIASTGGLALLCGNVELRVPLVGLFGLELYVDAGQRVDAARVHPAVGLHAAARAGAARTPATSATSAASAGASTSPSRRCGST